MDVHLGCKVLGHEGTEELKRSACKQLSDLAISSYGPGGRNKAIHASELSGAGVFTTSSGLLFRNANLNDYISRLLVQSTALAQHQQYGDGGLLSMHLACRLILSALDLSPSLAGRLQVASAYQLGLDWLAQYLGHMGEGAGQQGEQPATLHISLRGADAGAYVALARAVLVPKEAALLTPSDLDLLSVLVVQSFMQALPQGLQGLQPQQLPPVQVLPVVGLPLDKSQHVAGALLHVPLSPACASLLPLAGPLPLLAFSCGLDPSSTAGGLEQREMAARRGGVVAEEEGEEGWSQVGAELSELLRLVAALHSAGVKVVACQKVIHPSLQAALLQRGMLPLQRLGAAHLPALLQASGALPLAATALTPGTWAKCMGVVGGVRLQVAGPKTLLLITPGTAPTPPPSSSASPSTPAPLWRLRQQPLSTLLLGCSNDLVRDGLRAAVDSALKVMAAAMQLPYALPGGGCAEALMAAHLRERARRAREPGPAATGARPQLSALQVQALEALASGLEEAAASLVVVPCSDPLAVREAFASAASDYNAAFATATTATGAGRQDCGVDGASDSASIVPCIGWDHGACALRPVARCRRPHPPHQVHPAQGGPGPLHLVPGSAVLLDHLGCKLSAVSLAVEAAGVVLKLDGVVALAS